MICRFYDLEKWEAKQRKKGRLKALKKAQKQQVSIENDELRHKSLHSGPTRPGKKTGHRKETALLSVTFDMGGCLNGRKGVTQTRIPARVVANAGSSCQQ